MSCWCFSWFSSILFTCIFYFPILLSFVYLFSDCPLLLSISKMLNLAATLSYVSVIFFCVYKHDVLLNFLCFSGGLQWVGPGLLLLSFIYKMMTLFSMIKIPWFWCIIPTLTFVMFQYTFKFVEIPTWAASSCWCWWREIAEWRQWH